MSRPPRRSVASACESIAVALASACFAVAASDAGAVVPAAPPDVLLRADDAVARSCSQRLLIAGDGVAHHELVAPAREALTVRLDGSGGDWDLAVFDRDSGRQLGASSHFGAVERVTVLLDAGQAVVLQACHRSGSAQTAPLSLDVFPLAATAAAGERISLVRVAVDGAADVQRLNDLGLDVTHNGGNGAVDVAIYSDAQRRALAGTGLPTRERIADLPAADRRARTGEAATSRAAADGRVALPSGRTTYRTPAEYAEDLKNLALAYPDHVRKVTLSPASLEGRPIEGVEIASDVNATGDGRPTFMLAGLTHAREWPSGEVSIEFAIDMARTFAAGTDPRVTRLLRSTRILVMPLLNPDGFEVSRDAADAVPGGDDNPSGTTAGEALTDANAYKRKNCRPPTASDARPCAARTGFGVDLNRAYGAFWGGPGSSNTMTGQDYRGTAPFSEPEAQAIRALGAGRQIQTFVTNHTFTDVGRFLRQPGFAIPNDPVPDTTEDEARMKKLGDAMAGATGYVSELGYATLGNITGPSDDFLYYSQGTFGYTPELRGDNFHTGYANAVTGEYAGEGANQGRGLREAFMLAGEQAADVTDHAVLRGRAPAGRVLRIKKTTQLQTSADSDGDGAKDTEPMLFDETLQASLTVGPAGTFDWHVNPSTRPLLNGARESYTLTCEGGPQTVSRSVVVGRGQLAVTDPCEPTPPCTVSGVANPAAEQVATPASSAPAAGPACAVAGAGAGRTTLSRVRISILRPSFSARRTTRRRPGSVLLRVRGGAARNVRVRIADGRNHTILSGTRATLTRSGRVTLKLRRRVRAGRLRVSVTARDAAGRSVRASKVVRARR